MSGADVERNLCHIEMQSLQWKTQVRVIVHTMQNSTQSVT